jgi:hypothetical protein
LAKVRLSDGNPIYKQNAGLNRINIFDMYIKFIFRKGHFRSDHYFGVAFATEIAARAF